MTGTWGIAKHHQQNESLTHSTDYVTLSDEKAFKGDINNFTMNKSQDLIEGITEV